MPYVIKKSEKKDPKAKGKFLITKKSKGKGDPKSNPFAKKDAKSQ